MARPSVMTKVLSVGLLLVLSSFRADNKSHQLKDILFELNSGKLSDNQISELKIIIKTIRESLADGTEKTFTLWINGNADPSEHNTKQLSLNRAKTIRAQLLKLGLTEGTLIAKGYGAKRPLTNSDTDESRRRNARVDFKIKLE